MVIGSSTLVFFLGSQAVQIVPKAMFAALLVSSGCSMLADNLRQAWHNFPKREFGLVILHVALTATLGMLYGVVLGLLFTAVIFIIQYSHHSGVLQARMSTPTPSLPPPSPLRLMSSLLSLSTLSRLASPPTIHAAFPILPLFSPLPSICSLPDMFSRLVR